MATEVEICNAALVLIRGRRITSFDDDSLESRTCKDIYFQSRDALLSSHPWVFSTKRGQVAQISGDKPAYEFQYRFQLPADCTAVFDVDLLNEEEWRQESKELLTNNAGPLAIRYGWLNTDPSSWAPYFQELLSYKLASQLAFPISQNATLASNLDNMYKAQLRTCRSYSAQQRGSQEVVQATSWLTSRF